LPCPRLSFTHPNIIDRIQTLEILSDRKVLQGFNSISYLKINWEKDHSILNTGFYWRYPKSSHLIKLPCIEAVFERITMRAEDFKTGSKYLFEYFENNPRQNSLPF
jgi:hypothetical protein